jgi:hypothetical protein
MVVVGSVNNAGIKSAWSCTAPFVKLYAPGEPVASPYWDDQVQPPVQAWLPDEGTSPGT